MAKGLFDRLQDELAAQEKAAGLSMSDVLTLPDPLRKLVNWLIDQESVTLAEVVRHTDQAEAEVRLMLETLVDKGFLRKMEVESGLVYQIRFARKRAAGLPLDIWQALDAKLEEQGHQ